MTIATFHPVLVHGRSAWDLGELPRDEYEERRRRVRQVLAARELSACIVLGSTPSYANLAFLTGVRPGFMSSVMLLHVDHDPVLFAGLGGGRDLYHVRAVNYVDDVRHYASPADGARAVLAEWGVSDGSLGIVGARSDVPHATAVRLEAGLDGFELVPLDAAFFQLRRRKRSREVALLERSAQVVEQARDAAVAEFLASGRPHRAALVAERTARLLGARDVRILANLGDGPELRPISETSGPSAGHLVLHVGLERSGYWAESTVSFPRRADAAPAAAAVAAMRAVVRPGALLSEVAEAALSQLDGSAARTLTLEIGLGQGLGLGVEEELAITPTSSAVLEGGEVLSLRCVTTGTEQEWVADGSVVEVTGDGPRTLVPSWWA